MGGSASSRHDIAVLRLNIIRGRTILSIYRPHGKTWFFWTKNVIRNHQKNVKRCDFPPKSSFSTPRIFFIIIIYFFVIYLFYFNINAHCIIDALISTSCWVYFVGKSLKRVLFSAKMTPKHGYGFRSVSCTPLPKQSEYTPLPWGSQSFDITTNHSPLEEKKIPNNVLLVHRHQILYNSWCDMWRHARQYAHAPQQY